MKKSMFILSMLILASSYLAADEAKVGVYAKRDSTLQQRAYAPEKGYQWQVGDTIVISKDIKHYLTGEEPSTFVYYVRHIIQQIGGKRFPQGMLIQGIYSWIRPEDALLLNPVERTPEAEKKIAEDKPAIDQRKEEVKKMPAEQKREIKKEAEHIGTTPVEDITPAKDLTPKEDTPVVEQQPEQQQDTLVQAQEEQPKDTVKYGEVDRFTIGVRGGMATFMQNTTHDTKSRIGYDVLLDLQYAHYWQSQQDHLLGLLVGLSAGYAQGGLKNVVNDSYIKYMPDDATGVQEKIVYDVTADNVKETDREIQLEIPLMFSYIFNSRFFLNVGPRFMLPVYTPYNQKFNNTHITANFVDWGVPVTDELVTGKLENDSYKGNTNSKMNLNILLGLELGYEWTFENKNSLGLGVYANYDVYNTFKQDTQSKSLVDVTPASPTVVDVNAASNIYTKRMGYLDAGVKLAYHFNWWKEKEKVK